MRSSLSGVALGFDGEDIQEDWRRRGITASSTGRHHRVGDAARVGGGICARMGGLRQGDDNFESVVDDYRLDTAALLVDDMCGQRDGQGGALSRRCGSLRNRPRRRAACDSNGKRHVVSTRLNQIRYRLICHALLRQVGARRGAASRKRRGPCSLADVTAAGESAAFVR